MGDDEVQKTDEVGVETTILLSCEGCADGQGGEFSFERGAVVVAEE